MLTERTMQDRLLRIYDRADAACHAHADWYRIVAYRDCESIAADTDTPVRVVAALAAILSPGPKYATAMRDVRAMCEWWAIGGPRDRTPVVSTYGPNRVKAILALECIDAGTDAATVVSGPKVTAYFRNIMGEENPITLDRHAVRPLNDRTGKAADVPANKAERARMESAYRKAAAKRGIAPSKFQAVVWCARRGKAE